MARRVQFLVLMGVSWAALASLHATLVVNPALPITERVSVQIIQVADDGGTNPAPLFGAPLQQSTIFARIDTIWAQAGIDVAFDFRTGVWNSTFALTGVPGGNDPRPTADLNTIVTFAGTAGVVAADPNVINLFLVRIVPGFSQQSNNTSNGLAFIGANGITLWAGPTLATFANGQDVIASVLAHEIGHNLGLDHLVEAQNLMQAGGSENEGERLNAVQISTALASPFTVPIPEPATTALFLLGGLAAWMAGRRARAT